MNVYLDQLRALLFEDYNHAWILVSLLYLLAALFVQSVLVAPVKRATKRVSSKNLKSLHHFYLFRSLSGWFFFLIAWCFFILYWYTQFYKLPFAPSLPDVYLMACFVVFLLSVIFHLGAYAASCLDQIKTLEDKQLTP